MTAREIAHDVFWALVVLGVFIALTAVAVTVSPS